jgi:hypothetical protein
MNNPKYVDLIIEWQNLSKYQRNRLLNIMECDFTDNNGCSCVKHYPEKNCRDLSRIYRVAIDLLNELGDVKI